MCTCRPASRATGSCTRRAMAELLLIGRYQSIDLTRIGWSRVVDGTPLREAGII